LGRVAPLNYVLPHSRHIVVNIRTAVFVLCAGDGARWEDYLGVTKHEVCFGGSPLVLRTLAQFRNRGIQARIVGRTGENKARFGEKIYINQTICLADTIEQTRSYWSTRNIFVLGDVFFSDDAINRILDNEDPLIFFGRPWANWLVRCGHGELFGFSFRSEYSDFVISLLAHTHQAAINRNAGNLWNMHHIACGIPVGVRKYCTDVFCIIDDYTNDIDTPIDYSRRHWLYDSIALDLPLAVLVCGIYNVFARIFRRVALVFAYKEYPEAKFRAAPILKPE